MGCVQLLSAAALRRLFARVRQPVGAASSAPTAEVFAAAGYHFTRALRQANARAWFALEVLLAGERFWERAQLDWERDLDDELYHPLRLFLDCAAENSLTLTDVDLRERTRAAVRHAVRNGPLASGTLDIPALARHLQSGDETIDDQPANGATTSHRSPAAVSVWQLAGEWGRCGIADLRPALDLIHGDGTPLLILLTAAFFRRALRLDADLFGPLAEISADVDGDEALEEAELWAALFQDHRPRLEALLKELTRADVDARGSTPSEGGGNAAERLARGLAHAQRGQHEAAVSEYTAAIQLAPALADAYLARGEVHRLKGDYGQAVDDLDTALRLQPGNSAALLSRGQVHWLLRQHGRAIHDFSAFLEQHSSSAVGYYFRGKARMENGDLESAVADFAEAARLDPGHPWVFHDRGDAHAALADFDQAILDYTQALRLNPHSAISYLRRAEAYSTQGEFAKAVADFSEVLRLDPLNAAAYLGRGAAYRQLSQWAEANQDFSRALEHDETNPQLFYQRGLLYQQSGDYERAVQDLDAAIGLDPGDAELFFQRGRTHEAHGAHVKAMADLTQALRLNARHKLAYQCRGALHAGRGANNEALSDFSEALRLDADFAEAYASRARVLSNIGLLDDALVDCDAAIDRDPRIVEAYLVRGSALSRKGECARALVDFTQALQLDPENGQAFLLRGLAHHREGKLSQALADLSAVLRLDQRNARAFAHRAAVLQAAHQHERALCDLAHAMRLDHRYAAAYCRQLGVLHSQREEFERAVADYNLVLILEPGNQAARQLRNQAWKGFVAQCRSKPRPERQLGASALAATTSHQLPAVQTMSMPAASMGEAPAPAGANPAERAPGDPDATTEFEAAQQTTEFDVTEEQPQQSPGETTFAANPPTAPTAAPSSTKTAKTAVAANGVRTKMAPAPSAPPSAPPRSAVDIEHEKQAQEREKQLLQKMEEDRKQKMAEFQRKLEESKKEAEERRKKALARLGRRYQEDDDDEDRMPLWKKGMIAAAACIAVWFVGSWGLGIYANYQAQARFSLARLCRDFEQDANQARKKYDGGAFELTGKAKLVYNGRETRLALETPEVPQWSVHCRFDMNPESFKKMVADKIEPGQEVTVEGRCSYQPKEGKGIILMEECVLHKSKSS